MSEEKKPEATKKEVQPAPAAKVAAVETAPVKDQSAEIEALKAQLKAQEEANKKSQDKIVNELLARVGVSLDDLKAIEEQELRGKDMISVNIGRQVVTINGVKYTGTVEVPRVMAEVIISAAGNYRNQILREKIGNKYQIMQTETGAIGSRLIGPVDPDLAL